MSPCTTMSSRERLLTAIQGGLPDRVPIAPRMHPFLLERYGCACWLHYMQARAVFDFDPIILIQPWHHVKPDVLPNYLSYPLQVDYGLLADVETVTTVTPGSDGIHTIRRTFHTPAGTLTDVIEQLPPRRDYGIDPTPKIKEPLLKSEADLDLLFTSLPGRDTSAGCR